MAKNPQLIEIPTSCLVEKQESLGNQWGPPMGIESTFQMGPSNELHIEELLTLLHASPDAGKLITKIVKVFGVLNAFSVYVSILPARHSYVRCNVVYITVVEILLGTYRLWLVSNWGFTEATKVHFRVVEFVNANEPLAIGCFGKGVNGVGKHCLREL